MCDDVWGSKCLTADTKVPPFLSTLKALEDRHRGGAGNNWYTSGNLCTRDTHTNNTNNTSHFSPFISKNAQHVPRIPMLVLKITQ